MNTKSRIYKLIFLLLRAFMLPVCRAGGAGGHGFRRASIARVFWAFYRGLDAGGEGPDGAPW